ncbi:hypothetical protein [Corynebacterium sp. LK2510]|uniref:hypothetical protein n=1 Tax=Corynebacterium sp. LK2510 TaxID=3110472 RepID=UPI0034CE1FE5
MRRIATAAIAATTALSLAAVPATAQSSVKIWDGYEHDNSSDVTDAEFDDYILTTRIFKAVGGEDTMTSSGELSSGTAKDSADLNEALKSSYRNDANEGYKRGTTFDMILAAIALAILGGGGFAVYQGLIQLPF